MSYRFVSVLCASILASSAAAASAAAITFGFSGVVTTINDSTGAFSSTVAAGTPFTGQFTFQSTASDSNDLFSLGQYVSSGSAVGYSVTLGGVTFSRGSPLEIDVENNNAGRDSYDVNGQGDVSASMSVPGVGQFRSSIFLIDTTSTAVASDALPATPPTPAAYNVNIFSASGFAPSGGVPLFEIRGTVNSIVVPEPTTAVALGAFTLLGVRRKRG